MKKAILCFNSNNSSNHIISSTINKLEVNPITELTVERKNIDRINVIKYLTKKQKENDLPYVLYIYDNKKNELVISKITKEFPEVKIEIYTNELIYTPQRVPGNKLKTRVYLLADRMALDYENDYVKLNVYKVSTRNKTINEEKRSAFDMQHPRGNSYKCYLSKDEAVKALKSYMNSCENIYASKIVQLNAEIKEQEEKLTELKKENSIAISNL